MSKEAIFFDISIQKDQFWILNCDIFTKEITVSPSKGVPDMKWNDNENKMMIRG